MSQIRKRAQTRVNTIAHGLHSFTYMTTSKWNALSDEIRITVTGNKFNSVKTRHKHLSLLNMFRILQYPLSVQGCLQFK